MVMVCIFAYFLCIVGYLSPTSGNALQDMFLLSASVCYIAQIIGFILLRTTYKAESTGYKSPFGLIGAGYAICIYVMLAISVLGNFQKDDDRAALMLLTFFISITAYYFYVCKERQTIQRMNMLQFFVLPSSNLTISNEMLNVMQIKNLNGGLLELMASTWKTFVTQSTQTISKAGYSDDKTSVTTKKALKMC
ncbi:hypothetical protein THRCLA_22793 [Thraustotheca clavata]|uniref:Uncharacterized protein n=1 Tax=Thraustotheca clavata TaxID=74557 RepID=A0A1V9YSZ9_9STRA|nr:hypothetical protein THRCLA_22793 [Thraustotheca clavata]